jgi:hypothetical protein
MNFQAYTLAAHPDWACIQIKSPETEARQPVHLCCLIDTSGSMDMEFKLENVKRSLHFLLDFLGPEDKISIVTFSDTAKTVLSQVAVSATEKENIRARISIMRPESNTNISASIVECRGSLSTDTTTVKQGIILLTDGHANLGLTRPAEILELCRNTLNKFSGTSISCVGYGTDHNAELLQSISTEGGGSYYVVNNLEDVATVYGDILGALISCTSQQVRVILPAGTEIKSRYATASATGGSLEVTVGDMAAGAEAAFLARVPSGTAVTLKGYNLLTHNPFEVALAVGTTDDAALQANGEAHYLRFEVLGLLDQAKALISSLNSAAVDAHIQKINACVATITAHQAAHTNSLWDILLGELNACKEVLQNRHLHAIASPQVMTQRGGYLGQMRGLPAAMSQPPMWAGGGSGESSPVPGSAVPAAGGPVGRTFSNYAQQRISSQLAAVASARAPVRGATSAAGDPCPHSGVNSPAHGSPLFAGLTGVGTIMPPLVFPLRQGGPLSATSSASTTE